MSIERFLSGWHTFLVAVEIFKVISDRNEKKIWKFKLICAYGKDIMLIEVLLRAL